MILFFSHTGMGHRNGNPPSLSTDGFTVIEVVTVLLVIAVISTVAVSRSFFSVSPATETDILRTTIRYAQLRSMNTDSVWHIRFSESPDAYELFRDGASVRIPGHDDAANNERVLPAGLGLSGAPNSNILAFDSHGRPCTDENAETLLSGNINIDISDGRTANTITITERTGYIP